MTVTEIQARMNYLVAEAERDREIRRSDQEIDENGYKWILSPEIMNELTTDLYNNYFLPRTCKVTHYYGLPVQIDYQARDKIELWHNIDVD